MLFQGTTEQEGGQRTQNICELPCTGQGKMEMMEIEKTEIVAAILLVGFFFDAPHLVIIRETTKGAKQILICVDMSHLSGDVGISRTRRLLNYMHQLENAWTEGHVDNRHTSQKL